MGVSAGADIVSSARTRTARLGNSRQMDVLPRRRRVALALCLWRILDEAADA